MRWGIDWTATFVPKTGLLEIFVRGTLVYLCLFAPLVPELRAKGR